MSKERQVRCSVWIKGSDLGGVILNQNLSVHSNVPRRLSFLSANAAELTQSVKRQVEAKRKEPPGVRTRLGWCLSGSSTFSVCEHPEGRGRGEHPEGSATL